MPTINKYSWDAIQHAAKQDRLKIETVATDNESRRISGARRFIFHSFKHWIDAQKFSDQYGGTLCRGLRKYGHNAAIWDQKNKPFSVDEYVEILGNGCHIAADAATEAENTLQQLQTMIDGAATIPEMIAYLEARHTLIDEIQRLIDTPGHAVIVKDDTFYQLIPKIIMEFRASNTFYFVGVLFTPKW